MLTDVSPPAVAVEVAPWRPVWMDAHLDQSRDDHLHRLVDDPEAVGVVQAHDVGSHEGEDGHDVVQHLLLEDEDQTR